MNQGRHEAMPVVIPTGSATLDRALGVGGVPRGRIIEIFGPPASGKTTLALHIVAEAQRLGQAVAYIDGTHTLDPAYVRACGVEPERMPIDRPATTKEALARVVTHTEDNAVAALVLDAVQLLPPDDGAEVARTRAGLIAQALRLLTIAITRTNTAVIVLTPVSTEGDAERREGGQALKFYASVRLALQPAEPVRRGSKTIGLRIKAKVVKNKIAVPFHVPLQRRFCVCPTTALSVGRPTISTRRARTGSMPARRRNWPTQPTTPSTTSLSPALCSSTIATRGPAGSGCGSCSPASSVG
jgi:protein RecA